jgi:chemotaxis methyl-accepting protein methylase
VTAGQDEEALKALTRKISQARGVDCAAYKERCLKRRLAVRMRACSVHTYDDYSKLLDRDAAEYDRLLDALTINVTKFWRNAETWQTLADPYLNTLWRATRGYVRVWSAGCASGEEPYSLAVALAETARQNKEEHLLERARIDATDLDRESLDRTRAAEFAQGSFSEMPKELIDRYFTPQLPRKPLPALQRMLRIKRHDLTREPPPDPPYELVVCRNVIIYFDRGVQERLFQRFYDALVPGGVLLLGKVETLVGPVRERMNLEHARERIYSKPA